LYLAVAIFPFLTHDEPAEVKPQPTSISATTNGTIYTLKCIDGIQYIKGYRVMAARIKPDGLPFTCNTVDVDLTPIDYTVVTEPK
jgi:hypothetical protein